jgi:hypothetical protein
VARIDLTEVEVATAILSYLVRRGDLPGGVDCEVRTSRIAPGATVLWGDDLPKTRPALRLIAGGQEER